MMRQNFHLPSACFLTTQKFLQTAFLNAAIWLRYALTCYCRPNKSQIFPYLNLVVDQAVLEVKGLVVILGETTNPFLANDGRTTRGDDNYIGRHRRDTSFRIASVSCFKILLANSPYGLHVVPVVAFPSMNAPLCQTVQKTLQNP